MRLQLSGSHEIVRNFILRINQYDFPQMSHTLKILCYSISISQVLSFKLEPTCLKIDLLCYYAKESQLNCSNQRNEVETDYNLRKLPSKEPHEISPREMATGSRSYGLYRPRSGLARALYEKHNSDRYLEEFDQNEVCI